MSILLGRGHATAPGDLRRRIVRAGHWRGWRCRTDGWRCRAGAREPGATAGHRADRPRHRALRRPCRYREAADHRPMRARIPDRVLLTPADTAGLRHTQAA